MKITSCNMDETSILQAICNMSEYGRQILCDIYEAGNVTNDACLFVIEAMLAMAED